MSATLWTIGHATRPWDEFLAVLRAHRIEAIADVRRFPGSRKHPQYGGEPMRSALAREGIEYEQFPELGGRRKARADSPNTAWRNDAFRRYADYMGTPEYQAGEARLVALASRRRTAILCAEALWWRCHRSLISDDLKAKGWRVLHIADAGDAKEHPFTGAARLVGGRLSYAGDQPRLF